MNSHAPCCLAADVLVILPVLQWENNCFSTCNQEFWRLVLSTEPVHYVHREEIKHSIRVCTPNQQQSVFNAWERKLILPFSDRRWNSSWPCDSPCTHLSRLDHSSRTSAAEPEDKNQWSPVTEDWSSFSRLDFYFRGVWGGVLHWWWSRSFQNSAWLLGLLAAERLSGSEMTNTIKCTCLPLFCKFFFFSVTSFLPPWPLTPVMSPEVFLACSIKAFSCCMLLSSVLASSSRYSQVFFWASLTTGAEPPTGPTSRLDTSPLEGDATPVILAWTGWGDTAKAGSAVSTAEETEHRNRWVLNPWPLTPEHQEV